MMHKLEPSSTIADTESFHLHSSLAVQAPKVNFLVEQL